MNTREERAVLTLCLLTYLTATRAAIAEARARQLSAVAAEQGRRLAEANRRVAVLTDGLAQRDLALGALASAHGGRLEVSEHLLMRGPWDVFLSVDPTNHRHHVVARPRR